MPDESTSFYSMKTCRKLTYLLFLFFILHFNGIAQERSSTEKSEVEMADKFREDGKIYVVIAVILIILSGILIYTASIDRKVTKMEKQLMERKKELSQNS